jgi:RNA-directed DNA polymerase
VARIATFRDQGYTHVFEADIEKFFDHIDQELLLKEYLRRTKDRSLISILRAGFPKEKTIAQEDFENQRLDRGVPQGSAVSPLLSNLYLYPFDQHMQQAGLRMVRYADDFIVLAKSDAELEDIEATVREHIESRLKLTLNKEKTKPTSFEAGFTFLGFHFSAAGQNIGKKALDAAKEKTTGFLRITHDFQLTSTATHLNSYIKGWAIAYAPVNHQSAMKELDDHLIKMVRQALITIGIIGSKQLVSKKHLSRLGITTFGYELTAARSRYEGTIERRR